MGSFMVQYRIFQFFILILLSGSVLISEESVVQNSQKEAVSAVEKSEPTHNEQASAEQAKEEPQLSQEEIRQLIEAQKKQQKMIDFLSEAIEGALAQCQAFETFIDKVVPVIMTQPSKSVDSKLWVSL